MRAILQAIEDAQALIFNNESVNASGHDFWNFEVVEVCYMRHKSFGDIKAREHYHFTGEFLGAAHQYCNLIRKKKFKIPIYAHNFSVLRKLRVHHSQTMRMVQRYSRNLSVKNMLELLELMSSYIRSYISI